MLDDGLIDPLDLLNDFDAEAGLPESPPHSSDRHTPQIAGERVAPPLQLHRSCSAGSRSSQSSAPDSSGSDPYGEPSDIFATSRSSATEAAACAEHTVLYVTASGAMPAFRMLASQRCAAAASPARACAEMTDEYDSWLGESLALTSPSKAASASLVRPERAQTAISVF